MAGWAAISAGNLPDLELPEIVRSVVIAADNDKVGLNAANAAAHRFIREGRRVQIRKPPGGVNDFNDHLLLRMSCGRRRN